LINYYKNVKYNSLPTFNECMKALSQRFDDAEASMQRFKEENNRLKSEHYKDEELQEMASRLNKMRESIRNGFPIPKKEYEDANEWIKSHNDSKHNGSHHGAIGGAYSWTFVPTSIGTIGYVKCSICKEEHTFMEI